VGRVVEVGDICVMSADRDDNAEQHGTKGDTSMSAYISLY